MTQMTLRLVWSRPSTVSPDLPEHAGATSPIPSDCRSVENSAARQIPYYLILRAGHDCYVLDARRDLIRRGASQLLKVFARRHSAPQPLDGAVWDTFSNMHEFSVDERAMRCMFLLVAGSETPRQLDLLTML